MKSILLALFYCTATFVHIDAKPGGSDKNQKYNVEEIFCVDNVKLYFMSADKSITSKSECPKRLKVWRLKDRKLFLHIDNCLSYPLVPNITPLVHSKDGTITLPDLETKGAAISLKLPAGLDNVLLQAIQDEVENRFGERATSIINGADSLANELVTKTEELKEFIDQQTAQYRTGPAVQASSYKGISSGSQQVKTVSTSVLSATSWAANIMDGVYKKVGQIAAPHFQAGTSRIISSFTKPENNKEPNELTIASIKAYQKISNAVGKSTSILTETFKQDSVQVLQHNFGEDVGGAMDNMFDTARNTVTVIGHIRSFTPLGIIRNAAGHIVGYDPDGDGQSEHVCKDS